MPPAELEAWNVNTHSRLFEGRLRPRSIEHLHLIQAAILDFPSADVLADRFPAPRPPSAGQVKDCWQCLRTRGGDPGHRAGRTITAWSPIRTKSRCVCQKSERDMREFPRFRAPAAATSAMAASE